jgi:hypothetical protein
MSRVQYLQASAKLPKTGSSVTWQLAACRLMPLAHVILFYFAIIPAGPLCRRARAFLLCESQRAIAQTRAERQFDLAHHRACR